MEENHKEIRKYFQSSGVLKIWTINNTGQWQWKYISNFVGFPTKYQGKYNRVKFVPRRKCIALNAHFSKKTDINSSGKYRKTKAKHPEK